MAYVRTVKTSSGATAVQVVWSSRRGSRKIEHLGSAHDEAGIAALKAAAAQRLAAGHPRDVKRTVRAWLPTSMTRLVQRRQGGDTADSATTARCSANDNTPNAVVGHTISLSEPRCAPTKLTSTVPGRLLEA